ncbi:MAG: TrbG/VirB9 family P-type conjugative transfer protein [Alphaproteobacteria bacterium]|nr:TrbG/VirB9 family P-type conjugative transfer protein [Alphaproteobacteria bacterium]
MTLLNRIRFNLPLFCMMGALVICGANANEYGMNYGIQSAWDNPNANMAAGSVKPGYAQLAWSAGSVLPIKLRNGMVTMINLPNGEQISDAIVGNSGLFDIQATPGDRTMFISPEGSNQGSDTNMIVTGQSGNKYIFYLRSEPSNSSEITYSQVDITLDGNGKLPMAATTSATGSAKSIFNKAAKTTNTVGVDGEDYGWIKSMKIDPSEFRFDLDIFVPNPDDYVIAPERVWRDRIFTYIDFGDKVISMTQRPVVSLLVEGGESPVGFRTDGEDGRLLIVEAVGDMVLRSGQRIVCIKRREKPFLIADTASVMALAEANVAQSMLSGQSLNNIAYTQDMAAMSMGMNYTGTPMYMGNTGTVNPVTGAGYYMPAGYGTYTAPQPTTSSGSVVNMLPTVRNTAGSYLPQTNIPLISSNQVGVAVELKSDTNVKALEDHWTNLLAKFSGSEGSGILTPYKDMVFFAVDAEGVGDLGTASSAARMYRLRIGPISDISAAQTLCDKLIKYTGGQETCSVVRMQ